MDLTALNGLLQLSLQDTGQHAGFFRSTALCQLLEDSKVTLTAKLMAPAHPPTKTQKGGKESKKPATPSKNVQPEQSRLHIVVHGQMSNSHAIGNMLGESGFYLQHPTESELHHMVIYDNPHYLLRPGSELPPLERLSIEEDDGPKRLDMVVGETIKSQFMAMFDGTGPLGMINGFESSRRLLSPLQEYVEFESTHIPLSNQTRHQMTALAWMTEIESGTLTRPNFPSFWELTQGSSPQW